MPWNAVLYLGKILPENQSITDGKFVKDTVNCNRNSYLRANHL